MEIGRIMDEQEQLKLLKSRIESFEQRLRGLLKQTEDDVRIASEIQKLLMPNRIQQIPGLTLNARYIPSGNLSSECFDIIPTKDSKQLWIVFFWTESMGLNSLLFQTLVHLQSLALIEGRPRISPEEVFNDLCMELFGSKKEGFFRLAVMRLDVSSLNVTGVSRGMGPWIFRDQERNQYLKPALKNEESLKNNGEHLERVHSKMGLTADRAHSFSFHLKPGSRFFMMGREWMGEKNLFSDFQNFLALDDLPNKSDLVDDMNHLLIHAQKYMQQQKLNVDLSCLSIEIDSKKLHLA